MKISFEELEKLRPKALEARVKAYSRYNKMRGSKPRSPEETMVLVKLTVNRVRKAMEEGRWVLVDGELKRIEYRDN